MDPINILLAEDSFGDQQLFTLALKQCGNTTLNVVGDGREALSFLRKEGKYSSAPQPTLVVLDLNLPRMNGAEVLGQMREGTEMSGIPVAIFTGAKPSEQMREMCKLADFYIVKPGELEEYFAVVKALELFCRTSEQLPSLHRDDAPKI